MKKLIFLSAIAILTLTTSCKSKTKEYIKRADWCDNVKNNINCFIKHNKNTGNYVVFDFDNTSSIFDIEKQSIIYQIKHMAFNIKPDQLSNVLSTNLNTSKVVEKNKTYSEWINDISNSYTALYNNVNYGPFTYEGLSNEKMMQIQQEDDWKNFASKLRRLYHIISKEESHDVAYPWATYFFTGMNCDEVYKVGQQSHSYYKNINTNEETITSPNKGVGEVSVTFTNGISVTENIKELMKALNDNGIKVWICSASNIDLVRAAVDVFNLHDYVTGIMGMTNKVDNDKKMINEYDYGGKGYLSKPNNIWEKDNHVIGAQPQGKGKVIAINNVLLAKYGKGPIAGFMDSSGDFNFCTEYSSLQLVTCFNRADRSISSGGGLIAAISMYQQDGLKLDFNTALKNKDTLYLLQGRDENNLRSFRNSNKSILFKESKERLFKNEDNYKLLDYLITSKKPIKEYIDKFAIKTAANDPNNPLGVKYGFLTSYSGYHSFL